MRLCTVPALASSASVSTAFVLQSITRVLLKDTRFLGGEFFRYLFPHRQLIKELAEHVEAENLWIDVHRMLNRYK